MNFKSACRWVLILTVLYFKWDGRSLSSFHVQVSLCKFKVKYNSLGLKYSIGSVFNNTYVICNVKTNENKRLIKNKD